MVGYNDDLVLSFSIGLWVRETALRLRAEGIELSRKTLSNINAHEGVYSPEENTAFLNFYFYQNTYAENEHA